MISSFSPQPEGKKADDQSTDSDQSIDDPVKRRSFIKLGFSDGFSDDGKRRFTLIPIFIYCYHVIGTKCHLWYIEKGNFKTAKFIGLGISYFIVPKINVDAAPGTKAAAANSQNVTGGC